MSTRSAFGPAVAAFVAGGVITFVSLGALAANRGTSLLGTAGSGNKSAVMASLNTVPSAERGAAGSALANTNMVADAAAKVEPAVVDVHTQGRVFTGEGNPFIGDDNPFFRRFFGGPGGGRGEGRVVPRGAGSGVIISADGYIITNQHVIADADKVTVKVAGKGYDARVIGADEASDIAVVKVDPKGATLPVAELGNSDSVRVGDWAIAVGNPLDIGTSVTLGIVSALNRSGMRAEGHPLKSVIQTDAAINPGNSGGALANIQGQVIGINEAIFSPTGSYVGIGFAIPINAARKIASELIDKGKIVRPYIGVSYTPLKGIPPDARSQVGITTQGDDGVVVAQVFPGSPADAAGIKVYDVILEAKGQKLTDSESLNNLVQSMKVGDKLALLISHEGENRLVTVTLKERPGNYGSTPRGRREQRDLIPLP
jgi:S1-C subfamily serine protease